MSRDPTTKRRSRRYADALKSQGLVRVAVWVPADQRDRLRRYAARLRGQHEREQAD